MNKRKIILRADSTPSIGLGHVYRLLALAEFLIDEYECVFVTRTPSDFIIQQFNNLSIKYISLPYWEYPTPDSRKPFDEIDFDLDQILDGSEIVVLDGYWFGSKYQQAVKDKGSKLVFIDDLVEFDFKADVVLNNSPAAKIENYKIAEYTKLCIGFEYALLRKAFLLEKPKTSDKLKNDNLFISFGGSDYYNLLEKSLPPICKSNYWKAINVLIGSEYQISENLRKLLPDFSQVKIHKNLNALEVNSLMLSSDAALVPSSSVMIEALACKSFVIAGYNALNQMMHYNYLNDYKMVYGLGNFQTVDWSKINWDSITAQKDQIMANNPINTKSILSNYKKLFAEL